MLKVDRIHLKYTVPEAETCEHVDLGVPLPHDAHRLLHRAFSYWIQKCGNRAGPTWPEIDPVEIPELLSHTLVIDHDRENDRFVYRLAGTASYKIHNQDLTGQDIETLRPKAFSDHLLSDLRRMASDRKPQFVRLDFLNRDRLKRSYSVLRLPILDTDGGLDKVMVFSDISRFISAD